ncbi:glycosyltransferase family 4 protein [Cerasicoccus frondis]|uniref:glycosyltransferase family 4 protein n=1 Tax=Cerasicoccus frondis TaxID=490090 RepID=UPI0028524A4E|nr:glycosyltransferase family 4 protein [Cerasicoccus frondis]
MSETFIRAHEDFLPGEKLILTGKFPHYEFNGGRLIKQYNRHNRYRRLRKLLPQICYERITSQSEHRDIALRSLSEFFEHEQIDVLLAEYGMTGADITPFAQRHGIPLVVHFHGHDAYNREYLADYAKRLESMFDYASTVISVSEAMTKQLISIGAPPEKIQLNPYGPRDYFLELEPNYAKPQLIAVGRFVNMKAPYLTLAAFREALKTCPDARLIMVGDGELREACSNLAISWGISDKVDFPGALKHDKTQQLLTDSRAFVQHSIQEQSGVCEGTPVAILEAGAAALPVIATRHAGIPQAVIHGETGFLVEELDTQTMAKHMVQILQNEPLARKLGQSARSHIRENYSMERHLSNLQRILESAQNR